MRFVLALMALLFLLPQQTGAQTMTSTKIATFAGGCFWCMEPPFDKIDGVVRTTVGYTGGNGPATYQEVSAGRTGHTEAIEIEYDPAKVSYRQLLEVFWANIDPTTNTRQFCDAGTQYRPEIFAHDAEQRALAEASRDYITAQGLLRFDQPIVVSVTDASPFYHAEDYHQDYYKKNPVRYKFYRFSCGRDARLDHLWKTDRLDLSGIDE